MLHHGLKVLTIGQRSAIRRGAVRLPLRGERCFYLALPRVWLFVRWRAHRGYILCALCSASDPEHGVISRWSFGDEQMPIKKRVQSGELPVLPALSVENVVLRKTPALVEFLAATAYEDGSPRQPGYFTVRNRTIEYELTLYDPDAGMRVSIRARELDKVFFGAEAILCTPDAPWELDKYLWDKRPKEMKKKK